MSILIFTPIIGSIVVYLAGFASDRLSKALTIIISAATIAITLFIILTFNVAAVGFQLVEKYDWASVFGLTYTVGIDGISVPLLIISSVLTTLSAAGSWEQNKSQGIQRSPTSLRRVNNRSLHFAELDRFLRFLGAGAYPDVLLHRCLGWAS